MDQEGYAISIIIGLVLLGAVSYSICEVDDRLKNIYHELKRHNDILEKKEANRLEKNIKNDD